MTVRPRCYLASPLGFTEAGRDYLRRTYLPALAEVVEPVDPWSESGVDPSAPWTRELALAIGVRNEQAIRSCSHLVAYLEGQEPDAGTIAEVGFAAALGLVCFGLRSDLRQSGEAAMAVNLQVESFILRSGGRIVGSLEELVGVLGGGGG